MAGFDYAVPERAIRARVEEWNIGAPGTGLVWLGQTLVASGGDGRLHFADATSSELVSTDLHQGAILALAVDSTANRVITGGDDGKVIMLASPRAVSLLSAPYGQRRTRVADVCLRPPLIKSCLSHYGPDPAIGDALNFSS